MRTLALIATLSIFTGCAPFAGFAFTSGISTASYKSVEADALSDKGEAFLLMKLDQRYKAKQE